MLVGAISIGVSCARVSGTAAGVRRVSGRAIDNSNGFVKRREGRSICFLRVRGRRLSLTFQPYCGVTKVNKARKGTLSKQNRADTLRQEEIHRTPLMQRISWVDKGREQRLIAIRAGTPPIFHDLFPEMSTLNGQNDTAGR